MAVNPELQSLQITRDSLKASIASREKLHATASLSFRSGTDREMVRLAEVQARIKELTPEPPAKPIAPQTPPQPAGLQPTGN